MNRASFWEADSVGSQEKGEDGRKEIVVYFFPPLRCTFSQPRPYLLSSVPQTGCLELSLKACFLPAHHLFHRTLCAWPPSICRFGHVNYEHLAVPANQTAVSEEEYLFPSPLNLSWKKA